MSYHDDILKAMKEAEIDMPKTKHKANVPFVNTKVTRKEVEAVIWAIEGDCPTEADIVDRMWQEIEDLRSIIQKQIY